MSFEKLGLDPALLKSLNDQQLLEPTPIQEQVIPYILKGKDVLGIAKTGSGKTAGYALPLLQNLKGITSKNRHISALVMVPTRELAVQVSDVIKTFSKALDKPLITMPIYGGVSINPQMMQMNTVDVLVATPGRLIELVEANAVILKECKILVLDEADKMLSMGFKEEMDAVLYHLPKRKQNLLFSATLSNEVKNIQEGLLHDPVVVEIEEEEQDYSLIKQLGYRVTPEKKGVLLRHLIEEHDMQQVLIFCSSTYQVEHVNDKLNTNGIKSKAIHGKKSQGVRNKNLADFKNSKEPGVRCLVTTDLLSRGIDIEFLPYVINYELPRSPKDYIHRIGRTGRAENPGTAISLVTKEESNHARVIQKKTKLKIWMEDLLEWNS
ncbi:ATP-dependent RNA helicase RhlE [Nonlabens dokdonensis]|uniref:ATP-dependent RNA helicase n=2 Tax=Nonlabens dokdonensis TaxID=328515 RepID=L7WBX8_NONDD|nr:DEAD/DEAH box helicase [Nonlabens dokdonensis]AGC77609.1 ATP-dependent RNA helicase [Nonlabens dokdonensis DSW-6]PZX39842.1 ATP-dependent RNA helicase RhlE [Nonlabens dokdonensis]